METETIYKLLTRADWEVAKAEGVYRGSDHDLRDGYIHFSTASQLAETARKYFSGVAGLMLLAVEVKDMTALCWEPSRGGELFPHLYANLPVSAVRSAARIEMDQDGIPLLPPSLRP